MAIKTLRLAGRLLPKFIRIIAGFFRLLLGGIFSKILAKIYYGIFRLKKSGFLNKALEKIIRRQLTYLLIFTIFALFVGSNLINQNKASAWETKVSQTVMANLVPSEFNDLANEELIEDTATPNSILTAGEEKYLNNSCVLEKQTGSLTTDDDLEQNNQLSFNDEGDVVFKPQIITTGGGNNNPSSPQRTEIIYYTVQNGDTVSAIANKFGITVNTILWANNLTAFSLIRLGDRLTILPYSGILYTVKSGDTVSKIANQYGVEIDKILNCNNLEAGLKIGQKIIVPGAKKIVASTSSRSQSNYTGLSVIRDLIKSPTVKTGSGKMAWPTSGHRITQYFSWRHTGLDIGNKVGTPIYAADDGVVIISQGGWNGGYGNTIVIDHGGGKKTRYGHMSKLFVKVGDTVEKGENIAAMGSTGRSTGPHLHFEVLINGAKYNPLNYIK